MDFEEFPKISRWSRDVIITEKLDGTNACIAISEDGTFQVASRTRWITPEDDNYGFARWAHANKDELLKLGPGRHFGEWWGGGIQRNYGLSKDDKRFWLFNTSRWATERPACCGLVPVLYEGPNLPGVMEIYIGMLAAQGSVAAPGFMNAEGVVMFHTASQTLFKKTIKKDEAPKSLIDTAINKA